MILINRTLKSLCRVNFNKQISQRISVNDLLLSNGIRFYATEETALRRVTVRSMTSPRKFRSDYSSWFLLIIPISAFGLGTWQVFRKFQKDELNDQYLEIIKQPAVELPKNLDDLKGMEYRQVRVRGTFDHSKEIYMGPRPKFDESSLLMPSSLLSKNTGGYLVVTPFTLSDRNLTILVNRGWVPPKQKLPKYREEGQITGEVELVGLVRLHETRKPFGVKNSPEKGIWVFRDLEKMSEVCGTAPVFLDADRASTVPGGPLGGQTIVEFRNEHLSYIVTWYSLAGLSGYLWYLKYFTKPILV